MWPPHAIRADVERCWAGFAVGAAADALIASMALHERLASRTADALGFARFDAARVRAEVLAILAMAGTPRADGQGGQPRTP